MIGKELHCRGWLADHLYKGNCTYSEQLHRNEPETIDGYHVWGKPVARAMRRHTWFAAIIWFVSRPVILEMAARGGHRFFGSPIGHAMLAVGLPICRWIGRREVKDMEARKREARAAR